MTKNSLQLNDFLILDLIYLLIHHVETEDIIYHENDDVWKSHLN